MKWVTTAASSPSAPSRSRSFFTAESQVPPSSTCKLFDAAHAHGWRPPVDATACWSFYPTKTLGAYGDGGAVTTNDMEFAATMRKLSGRDDQFHDARQITSRMDEIQAAILRVRLRHLDDWLSERHRLANLYMQYLPEHSALYFVNDRRSPPPFRHKD